MKIIVSVAGGGKTTKMIELAIQHIKEGKTAHVISGEMYKEEFGYLAHEQGMSLDNLEQIKFTALSRGMDMFEAIDEDDSDVVLLDNIGIGFTSENPFAEMNWNYILKELKKTEERKGIEIYVTRQASRDNNLARTPVVTEYKS